MPRLAILLALLAGLVWAADEKRPPPQTLRIPRTVVTLEMIQLPAGSIVMPRLDEQGQPLPDGSKEVVHIKPIWMSQTEIPWEAFDVFAYQLDLADDEKADLARREGGLPPAQRSRPGRPWSAPDCSFGHAGFPVISVQYLTAQQYCRWLSEKTRQTYRLPTEAEWEYACRAGNPPQLLDAKTLGVLAWYAGNSATEAGLQTHPVAGKLPNGWGFHDMLGNAAEWTEITQTLGVARGGSYRDRADDVQFTSRQFFEPAWQKTDPQNPKSPWWLSDGPHIGFRIVRED